MLNVLKVWTGFDPANSSRWLPPSELNNKPRRWSKTFWANRFLLAATNAKSVMEFPQDGAESRTATRGRWVAALLLGRQASERVVTATLRLMWYLLRSFPGKPGLPSLVCFKPVTRAPSKCTLPLATLVPHRVHEKLAQNSQVATCKVGGPLSNQITAYLIG